MTKSESWAPPNSSAKTKSVCKSNGSKQTMIRRMPWRHTTRHISFAFIRRMPAIAAAGAEMPAGSSRHNRPALVLSSWQSSFTLRHIAHRFKPRALVVSVATCFAKRTIPLCANLSVCHQIIDCRETHTRKSETTHPSPWPAAGCRIFQHSCWRHRQWWYHPASGAKSNAHPPN